MKSILRFLLLFLVGNILVSCAASQLQFRELHTVKTMHQGWIGNYSIQPTDSIFHKRNLIEMLELHRYDADSICQLQIMPEALVIRFKDRLGGLHYVHYQGKLKQNCFEFYTEYETLNFPPLLIMTQKTKIQLYRLQDSSLVVRKKYDHSGMLLFFGAGNSGAYYSIFKSKS